MREIKFRAWDKLNYKWAYFTIGQVWGEVHLIVYHRIILDGGKFYQYTGLKDKNGKEIYEGDIFKYWWEWTYIPDLVKIILWPIYIFFEK